MIENRIAEVLTERFKEEDLDGCFLINVEEFKGNKVVVYVECDTILTIDMCRKISRFLEKQIEENKWLPERYTLDVSSPGTDNPLKLFRQYLKNIGRNASVKLKDGNHINGKLVAADDDMITLEVNDKESKTIPFNKINETKILVSFKKR